MSDVDDEDRDPQEKSPAWSKRKNIKLDVGEMKFESSPDKPMTPTYLHESAHQKADKIPKPAA